MTVKTEWVEIEVESSKMDLFLARPSHGGRAPGVLVLQEIFGVNHHIQSVAQRIAQLGYVAIAPDLLSLAKEQHGNLMLFWGGKDEHIGIEKPRQVADALRAAGKPFANIEFAAADHGFFCDERKSYHAPSAAQAWALVNEFLKENLKTA